MAKETKEKAKPKANSKRVKLDINSLIASIDKKYGEGTIQLNNSVVDIETISTRIPSLDYALGVGGLPRGRVVEVYGQESCGKTTLCLSVVAEAQSKGLTCAFIDAEHALDPTWAANIGVDVSKLLIHQPSCGEEAFDVCEQMINSGSIQLIIIDSVAALTPQAELDGDMGDQMIGVQARMMGKGLRKINGIAKTNGCTVIFINQLREKIGVMFGNPITTTGGKALKFYASIRMDIAKTGVVKEGEISVASQTRVKVVKNKCAAPFTEATFQIAYGKNGRCYGPDMVTSLMELAEELGVIKRSGSSYKYGEVKLGSGMDNASTTVKTTPGLKEKINDEIMALLKSKKVAPVQKIEATEDDDYDDSEDKEPGESGFEE